MKIHGRSNLTERNEKVKEFLDPRWGSVLRKMRKSQKYTLRKVGETIKFSHVSVQAWEAGRTPISQSELYMLLDLYQYSFLDFIALLDKEPKNQ